MVQHSKPEGKMSTEELFSEHSERKLKHRDSIRHSVASFQQKIQPYRQETGKRGSTFSMADRVARNSITESGSLYADKI